MHPVGSCRESGVASALAAGCRGGNRDSAADGFQLLMHEGRVDVIGGGAIIVEELADALGSRAGIAELVVSEHDILDGIALSIA